MDFYERRDATVWRLVYRHFHCFFTALFPQQKCKYTASNRKREASRKEASALVERSELRLHLVQDPLDGDAHGELVLLDKQPCVSAYEYLKMCSRL